MRPAQKSNRSRGRGNRKGGGGGGGGGNNLNRVYDSAGPEGKVRGTPQQIIDKYVSLARDAQTSGDRVASENFLQHAEHYQRLLIQAMGAQENARRDQNAQPDQSGHPDQDGQPDLDAQGEQSNGNGAAAAPAEQPKRDQAEPAPEGGEIGGMTTIDANEQAGPSLLVEAEDVSVSQPRRNGNTRRRTKVEKPAAEEAAAEAPAKTGASDEAEGAQAET